MHFTRTPTLASASCLSSAQSPVSCSLSPPPPPLCRHIEILIPGGVLASLGAPLKPTGVHWRPSSSRNLPVGSLLASSEQVENPLGAGHPELGGRWCWELVLGDTTSNPLDSPPVGRSGAVVWQPIPLEWKRFPECVFCPLVSVGIQCLIQGSGAHSVVPGGSGWPSQPQNVGTDVRPCVATPQEESPFPAVSGENCQPTLLS